MNNDLQIGWGNNYGAHTIKAYGGWRYNNYSYSFNYMRGYNNENDKLPNLSKDMQYINYGGTNDNWIDMAYYVDANYNYKNRYFADFTVSSQAGSRFGDDTKDGFQLGGVSWGVFPSLQLGWLISSENWFKLKGIDYLKLTAGVDQSGNDDLDYYAARTYWESQQVTENTVGLYLKNIENSTIQWETTTKYNIALEGNFLNNRLYAGVDLFWHKTDNLLTVKDIYDFACTCSLEDVEPVLSRQIELNTAISDEGLRHACGDLLRERQPGDDRIASGDRIRPCAQSRSG